MDNKRFLVVVLLVFVTLNLLIILAIHSTPLKIKITGNAASASSYASLKILLPIQVVIDKIILTTVIDVGDTISFNITILNTGNTNITTLLINDTFNPTFLNFTNAEITPNQTGSNFLFWNISTNLGYNDAISFVVNFTALAPGDTINNVSVLAIDVFNETDSDIESVPFTIGAVAPTRREGAGGGRTGRRTLRREEMPPEEPEPLPPEEKPTVPSPPVEEKPELPAEIPPVEEKPVLPGGGNLTNMTFLRVLPYSTLRNFLILLAAIILVLMPILLRERPLIFMDEKTLKSLIVSKKLDKYKKIHVVEDVYHRHIHLKNLKPLIEKPEDKTKINKLLSRFNVTKELATLVHFASKSKKKCRILTEHRLFTELNKTFKNIKFSHDIEEELSFFKKFIKSK